MSKPDKTNVMRILDQKKIPYTPHFYEGGDPTGDRAYGLHVAQALGQDPDRVYKTLTARGASKQILVYVIPTAETLDLKKAARAAGEKSIALLHVSEIQSVTGYVRGGCSPVGLKKPYPVFLHDAALDQSSICISAGRIGAQVELNPADLLSLLRAGTADLITQHSESQMQPD